jgi:hypothetical protein
MKYKILGRSKYKIRDIAYKHYIETGDPEKAILKSIEEIKTSSIVISILVGLAIKLAIELIWYWFNNKISHPSIFYADQEPGA